jgi:hypothetical protein
MTLGGSHIRQKCIFTAVYMCVMEASMDMLKVPLKTSTDPCTRNPEVLDSINIHKKVKR